MNRHANRLLVPALLAACIAAAVALGQNAAPPGGRGARGGRGAPPAVTPEAAEFLRQMGNTGIGVHDPSTIVQCKDEYWVFCTGTSTPSFHSRDLRHWEPGKPVNTEPHDWLREVVPGFRGSGYWAPDVIKVGDRYLLFYSASAFGKNTSGIGVLSSPTLDQQDPAYHWQDGGLVVASRENDDFNCIDPAAFQDKDGSLWLSFGSFWSGIKLIQLDPATGRRIAPNSPMYSLAHWDSIEASYIYRHGDYYYLFVSLGMCCRGANSTYHTRVGRASKVTGPYLDKQGHDLLTGGGTMVADTEGAFIGPGHAGIVEADGKSWFSCHFYNGSANGASMLSVRPLTWTTEGWPVVGKLP
jgi:arabinan endo-1,5-alpha-L-arabinosidase